MELEKRALGASGNSWKDPRIPGEQIRLHVDRNLRDLRRGNPIPAHTVAAEALKAIPGSNKMTLLEVGCAIGYYSEVILTLVGKRFEYTGSDYSDAMLAIAKRRYPNTKFLNLDMRHIELPDRSYDVVLSGAVVIHVKEWREAINELARVASSYLMLHRTPITNSETFRIEKKIYADIPVFYTTFNRDEIMNLISKCGFKKIFEKNIISEPAYTTYVFERVKDV